MGIRYCKSEWITKDVKHAVLVHGIGRFAFAHRDKLCASTWSRQGVHRLAPLDCIFLDQWNSVRLAGGMSPLVEPVGVYYEAKGEAVFHVRSELFVLKLDSMTWSNPSSKGTWPNLTSMRSGQYQQACSSRTHVYFLTASV